MDSISYPGFNIDLNSLSAIAQLTFQLLPLTLNPTMTQYPNGNLFLLSMTDRYSKLLKSKNKPSATTQVAAAGISTATDLLSNKLSDGLLDDSEIGRVTGTLFSSGLSSAGNTMADNLLKGLVLTEGLGLNTGASLAGAGAGIAANYIGKGITSAMGDSRLGRAVGAGTATGLGALGGTALLGAITGVKTASGTLTGAAGAAKALSNINPYALGATVLGTALGAATGPSKEYGGTYGNVTRTMDTIYDIASVGANFIPGAGLIISGAMVLNKGLSNIFGSTDGMTLQDSILGSAFMPAPVKWLNMAGASKTGGFDNQSWLNSLKTNTFMQDAFGNLSDRFDLARKEAGKTYGTFSQGARKKALRNLDFANSAWDMVNNMADLNIVLNIRSLDMTSINNQRYALMIQGGYKPLAIGKQGMKILNNSINHNLGLRFLSGAALIDNKQIILSRCKEVD